MWLLLVTLRQPYEIGGFTISTDALSSDNFFISGAATNTELFISSSGFSVDARGIVSASALSLTVVMLLDYQSERVQYP